MEPPETTPLQISTMAKCEPSEAANEPTTDRSLDSCPNLSETNLLTVEWEAPGQECEICGSENLTPEQLEALRRKGIVVY